MTNVLQTYLLLQSVFIADASLDGRALGDAVDPLEQMGELIHLVLGETRSLPAFDPRPGLQVGHADATLAVAGQIVARFAREFARQPDFEDTVDPERFVTVPVDGVCEEKAS